MQPHGQSLKQLMQEAVALRDRFAAVKDELDQTEFTGTAGNGQVVVNVRGTGETVSVHIDPNVADPREVATLEQLVLEAIREAQQAIQTLIKEKAQIA